MVSVKNIKSTGTVARLPGHSTGKTALSEVVVTPGSCNVIVFICKKQKRKIQTLKRLFILVCFVAYGR